jgi:hypothetical protein
MADLNFYLSNAEKIELLELLYSEDCKIVPDLEYDSPEYIVLDDIDKCLKYIDINSPNLLFIIHSKFSSYPLRLEPIKKQDKIKYYIRQRYGGPSLSLYITGLYNKENILFLGHGFLSYYAYYYDPINNQKLITPEDLKSIFKQINKWISTKSVPFKLHSRIYKIGKDAIKQAIEANYNLRDINSDSLIELKKRNKL